MQVQTKDFLRQRIRELEARLSQCETPPEAHRKTAEEALRRCSELVIVVETLIWMFPESFT
jgi:hypothetical protein